MGRFLSGSFLHTVENRPSLFPTFFLHGLNSFRMFHIFPHFVSHQPNTRKAEPCPGLAAFFMLMTTVTLCDRCVKF